MWPGKRVLLVDFHSLESVFGGSKHDDHSVDLRRLFRDVDMNDAIIFFDECEALFKKVKIPRKNHKNDKTCRK